MEGVFSKINSSIATIVMSCVAIFMFSISMVRYNIFYYLGRNKISSFFILSTQVPHASVDNATYQSVWPVVKQWHSNVNNYELTHAYGLFRKLA